MPSEDISAQQAQGLTDPAAMWAANHRSNTQGDYDFVNRIVARMNPVQGEVAPKYFQTLDPTAVAAQTFSNPYSPENLAKQNHPMSLADYTAQQAALPTTVYGSPGGRFVESSGPGGRGGQTIGGFVQLGGSKSQGPSFDQLGSGVKYDRSKAVWDDNYGWIMPVPQEKAGQGDWIPGALQMGASLAAGAVGIPTWAMGAIQAAQGYGNGQSLGKIAMNIAPSLIGAGLGGNLNLPPEILQALQAAKYLNSGYGAYKQFQQGNPVGGAMTIGKLAGNFIPTGG